jgi:hypothetical protein
VIRKKRRITAFIILKQYRTKIVLQTHRQLFRQLVQNEAGIPTCFKDFWAKMTEKMQAYARQSAQRGLSAVLP